MRKKCTSVRRVRRFESAEDAGAVFTPVGGTHAPRDGRNSVLAYGDVTPPLATCSTVRAGAILNISMGTGRLGTQDIERAIIGRTLVITGAGLSADSGLQTFRGAGGLWRNYDPRSLATPEAFARDPKLVWEWYQWRRSEAAKAEPNAGHLALASLATRSAGCLIVTQNVDDLHERANTPRERLVHVHGDLFLNRCQQCSYSDRESLGEAELPPPCPQCKQALLRPGVVWFGERLDLSVLKRVDQFISRGTCDLVLVVGTTATFQYIIDWALEAKHDSGLLVEINPEETPLSDLADVVYRELAAEVLPKLLSF